MFRLDPSQRLPFDKTNIDAAPRSTGLHIIYDLAGPIHAGRSAASTFIAACKVISMGQVIATWPLPEESAQVYRPHSLTARRHRLNKGMASGPHLAPQAPARAGRHPSSHKTTKQNPNRICT